jgi:phage-related protein
MVIPIVTDHIAPWQAEHMHQGGKRATDVESVVRSGWTGDFQSQSWRTKSDTLGTKTTLKRLPARFYRSDTGREPVREWLKSLDANDRRIIGEDIKDVEFSWPIGMPLVRSLGRDIWEVRSSLPHGRIARVLFCVEKDCMVLLHGFMKKTQKTPKQEIDLAIRRKKGGGA